MSIIKNQSNSLTTVKSVLRTLPSDYWTIDNFSLYCNYDNILIIPDGLLLDEYRDYFDNLLIDVDVDPRFFYSPSGLSQHYYGTPDLDFLILYFAKIPTLFEFNHSTIKMLPVTALSDLNKLIVEHKEDIRKSNENPVLYRKLDDIEVSAKIYKESISGDIKTSEKNSNQDVRPVIGKNKTSKYFFTRI